MTPIYTIPCERLRIAKVSEFLWRVECPGDASLARVASLAWDQGLRRWTLRRADLSANSSGVDREWGDPSSNRPRYVPGWVESAVFAQIGAWALRAAVQLLDRETVVQACLAELAVRLEAHRDDAWESNERDGEIDDPETAAYIAELDGAIATSRALLEPKPARGEEEGAAS